MPPIVIDLIIAALIVGMTYALMSEGLWGAALMFFDVLFAAIITFNFYEPLAAMLATNMKFLAGFADTICMLGIFCASTLILRLTTESLAPAMVRYPMPLYHLGRTFFAFMGSVITVAIILLAYECAPVHKKVFSVIDYTYKPPFKMGIDREWLGFFQYTTGKIFTSNSPNNRDPYVAFGNAKVFDPKAEWLIRHQEARPYGEGDVIKVESAEGAGAPAGEGAGGAAGMPGGAAGMPGGRPGDPTVLPSPGPGGGVVIPQ